MIPTSVLLFMPSPPWAVVRWAGGGFVGRTPLAGDSSGTARKMGVITRVFTHEEHSMFDHILIGVSDYAASKAFFLAALAPLGLSIVSEGPLGVELSADDRTSLCLRPTAETPAYLHLAFLAASRAQVDAFHRAALAAGARDNGGPGLRPQYHANYYAAFVIGPDGHNVEVVCHAAPA